VRIDRHRDSFVAARAPVKGSRMILDSSPLRNAAGLAVEASLNPPSLSLSPQRTSESAESSLVK